MSKKQTKHFVPNKDNDNDGIPACGCYSDGIGRDLPAFYVDGEVAITRRGVTCGRCRKTDAFRRRK